MKKPGNQSHIMYIDGEWVPSSDEWIDVRDPSTGRTIDKVPSAADDDVDKAVDAAKDAFDRGVWSKIAPGDRANALLRIASMLEQISAISLNSRH
jgi:acyl-CoA reductase-like NAD-dependent aldehyde dehydrogenase